MPLQRYKPEQIVTMLRQIEVGIANGKNTPTSLQRSRDRGADVLPLAQGIRRFEDGPGETPSRCAIPNLRRSPTSERFASSSSTIW